MWRGEGAKQLGIYEQWKVRVPGCLDYIGDEQLPSYMGIIMNHDKDPYKPTSIMESKSFFSWLICIDICPVSERP